MRARLVCNALLILVAACGSGGGGGKDEGDGGSPTDAASVTPDGAPIGPVRLTDSKIFPQRASSTQITFGLDADGPGTCLSEYVAGCEVQDCEAATGILHVSAGTVTLTTPLGEAVHEPADDGLYPTAPAIDWEPGDTITLAVAGSADIAPFEAEVPGPGTITTVSAPDLAAGVTVPRDEPLAFAWEGADTAVTAAVSCPLPEGIQQVRCRFPDGVLGGTMPAAALGRLPACDGNIYLLTEERILTGPPDLAVRFGPRGLIHSGTASVE
ncbi:MAG TPA: hypothetical protein VMZ28_25455 [Kofleriaceae bacterium]|nr:hypothetical protein [Kofleriaceae bacterium]